ncbi:uncharacterized protein CLUP02_17866 [Colletotrichum lupini]|uniref:FAD-binding domain-containing protein n=1 Tax=Colletotrichum lupini TaxID=145971 RepID=A0A9Q8SFW7_9PEZI|nr:uncharacterized protein CLUP02_17866 [Colletotrichum lupini]UQC76353.1 hypothetical protein CLUP02_17866 [Colletotrichum lupini]
MKVVIIGAGIGGLVCAISCRREGLEVVVLEQAAALQPVGAGIQIPPNAARILRKLGLVPQLLDKATLVDTIDYLRYKDGKVLYQMEGGEKMKQSYGDLWMVIARPHYHGVLWSAAKEAGAELRLGTEAVAIDFKDSSVRLGTGEIVRGDVVVGADGQSAHISSYYFLTLIRDWQNMSLLIPRRSLVKIEGSDSWPTLSTV